MNRRTEAHARPQQCRQSIHGVNQWTQPTQVAQGGHTRTLEVLRE